MTEVTTMQEVFANEPLVNNEYLTGHVLKPYLKDGELMGAVLAFDGRRETALLHIRQMSGDSPAKRLAELGVGDPLYVRMIIIGEGRDRKIQATELGVQEQLIVETLKSANGEFKGIEGRVNNITDFGVFITMLNGPAEGHTGLVPLANLSKGSEGGRVKLGSFLRFKKNDLVHVDIIEGRIDQVKGKLLLRLDNLRPQLKLLQQSA
jgi:ribosomal protein S1